MKIAHLLTLVSLLLFLAACEPTASGDQAPEFKTNAEALSYAIGANMGESLNMGEFTDFEKDNADKIVDGFLASIEADEAGNTAAAEAMQKRFNNKQAPTNAEEGEQMAYYLGYSIVGPIAEQTELSADDFDRAMMTLGMNDALTGDTVWMDRPERDSIWTTYIQPKQQEVQAKMQAEMAAKAEVSKVEGVAFLEENKTKPGIQVTESGLQYEVIEKGSGKQPTAEDNVKVHYTGQLLDGTVFDSSVERGEPATFPLNRVIPGWTEGVALMKEGAKYRFYIPQELAYGENGSPGGIPGFATLIFDVELLEVNPAPAAPAPVK